MSTSTNIDDGMLISIDQVSIGYGGRALMRPLSLDVGRGEFWGVVGPNGAGKSTLIKTILGIIGPVGGVVAFPAGPPRFGYVPQHRTLDANYPLTAYDVALMGRFGSVAPFKRLSADDRRRTREELARLGVESLAQKPFSDLSGGQQQRVLLARALTSDPDVLILDEPVSGMDLPGEHDILSFLKRLHDETRIAIVMISHSLNTVVNAVDHLCLINKDLDQFFAGSLAGNLSANRLSELYDRPMEIDRSPGGVRVRIGGRKEPRDD